MLLSRGSEYAAQDLAASYTKERDPLYNKTEEPDSLVSLTQAENGFQDRLTLGYLKRVGTNKVQFLMQDKALEYIKAKVSMMPLLTSQETYLICAVYMIPSFWQKVRVHWVSTNGLLRRRSIKLVLHTIATRMPASSSGVDLSACLTSPTWRAEGELKQQSYDCLMEMAAGRAYHDESPGRFRFIFSVDRDTLIEGFRKGCEFLPDDETRPPV
jgi:hypothetical protein